MAERFQVFFINNKTPLTIICFLIVCVFIAMLIGSSKKEIQTAKTKAKKKATSGATQQKLRNIYFFCVEKLKPIPIMGDTIRNMSATFQCQYAVSDEQAMMLVGKFIFRMAIGGIIGGIFAFYIFTDFIIAVILGIIFAKMTARSVKIDPAKFLVAMQDAIDDFIHSYHEHSGNIDQAFFDIINSDSMVAGHFNIMYDYIKRADVSQNPEEVQKSYNRVAPSKILRNFYSVVYMTYKYGDTKIDGKSAFSSNIYQLQEAISSDLYELQSLRDGTFGENVFIVISIFMLPAVEWYMVNYFNFEGFEYVQQFLTSTIGYMIKIFCAAVSFICYLMYERMTDINIMEKRTVTSWENKMLHNLTFRSFVNFIAPKEKRGPLQDKLLRCGSQESVAALTCKRILITGAVGLICAVSIIFNIIHTTNLVLNDPYQGVTEETYTEKVVMMFDDTSAFIRENVDADKRMISYIKANYPSFLLMGSEDQEAIMDEAAREININNDRVWKQQDNSTYVKMRILSKMTLIQETQGMYNVLFFVAAVIGAFYMPLVMVQVQSILNKESLIQSETADLQRITMMLIQHSTCTPEQLLSWYTNSTMLFARQFHEASITRDLDALSASIGYKPFTQLMSCLSLALINHMSLDEAFSGIEQKMRIQEKEQQRKLAKITKFRVSSINSLTSICLGCVLGLYMMVPMGVSMLQMFEGMNMTV